MFLKKNIFHLLLYVCLSRYPSGIGMMKNIEKKIKNNPTEPGVLTAHSIQNNSPPGSPSASPPPACSTGRLSSLS